MCGGDDRGPPPEAGAGVGGYPAGPVGAGGELRAPGAVERRARDRVVYVGRAETLHPLTPSPARGVAAGVPLFQQRGVRPPPCGGRLHRTQCALTLSTYVERGLGGEVLVNTFTSRWNTFPS